MSSRPSRLLPRTMDLRGGQHVHVGNSEHHAPTIETSVAEDAADKASRKRDRELSMEPAAPQKTLADTDIGNAELKETRTPAKKNRTSVRLDATEEEDQDSSVSCSPPTESKIRQISQGVEDMTWRHIQKDSSSDRELEMHPHGSEPRREDQMETELRNIHEDVGGDDLEEEPIKAKVAGGDEIAVPPVLLQGANPPQITEGAGEDEHAGQADPTEVPPDAQPPDATVLDNPEVHPEVSATSAIPPVTVSSSPLHSRRNSESDIEAEKGVKRKLRDRTVSERFVPGEVAEDNSAPTSMVGAMKRQRDDADADANPRVTKRPTPPPEKEVGVQESEASTSHSTQSSGAPAAPSTPEFRGFMAYASTSSPFASVSGPSIFIKSKSPVSPSSPFASSSASTSFASAFTATPSSSPTKSATNTPETPLPQKRTGFEAFASTSSPFASVAKRPKSPPPPAFSGGSLSRSRSPSRRPNSMRTANAFSVSAFSAYAAGGAQGFSGVKPRSERASPAPSEGSTRAASLLDAGAKDDADEESGNGAVSFSERLRSQKDEEDSEEGERVKLTEQEVHTGEEEEETIYQVRGKLYALSPQNQWKERGTGTLKLNVRKDDGTGARLIMRKEAVYTVLLNATLFKGMKCFTAQDPRYIRFSVFESGAATHYNLRVQTAKVAEELIDEINSHIPGE